VSTANRGARIPGRRTRPFSDAALALGLVLVLSDPVTARPTPAQKCTSAKAKAAAREAAAKLGCHAKAASRGAVVDAGCLAEAEARFARAFATADAKGGCLTAGDAAAMEALVDAFAQQAVETLPGGTTREAGKCAAAKRKAAGKHASARLRCHAKAATKGTPPDGECLAKADGTFARAFGKAEAKGGCTTIGDADEVEAQADSFVDRVIALLAPTTTPTTTTSTTTMPAAVSFATHVQPIFSTNCALPGCHTGTFPAGSMNLSAGMAYGNTVNVASFEVPALVRVLPGDPANSYLYRKITNAPGIVGVPMPFGFFPLPASQIATIEDWITQGALND
jgi:hypothetical protein